MGHHQFTKSASFLSQPTENKTHYLDHFTHNHPLRPRDVLKNEEFLCKGCNIFGSGGVRYECSMNCKFYLHEECATCPTFLSTHIHPLHQLELNWEQPDDGKTIKKAGSTTSDGNIKGLCHVCGEQVVKGLYYTCPSCRDFFIHPICTSFPERLQHVIDKKHGDLTFQSAGTSECAICKQDCTSWRYRCGPCGIDIHLECVTTPIVSSFPSPPGPPPSAPPIDIHPECVATPIVSSFPSPPPSAPPHVLLRSVATRVQKSPPPSTSSSTTNVGGYYAIGLPASPPYYYYSPPPYGMYQQQHHYHHPSIYGPPLYQQAGSGVASSSSSSYSTSSKMRMMFAVAAKIAATVALGAVFGI